MKRQNVHARNAGYTLISDIDKRLTKNLLTSPRRRNTLAQTLQTPLNVPKVDISELKKDLFIKDERNLTPEVISVYSRTDSLG